jgi:hypothetical protein
VAKLYSVRIDEVAPGTGRVELIGKRQPLASLAQVRDFLVEYSQAWRQLLPPLPEVIEAEFETQRAALAAEDGPPLPGSRTCRFTLYPYAAPNEQGEPIEHVITILELTGTLSAQGQEALLAKNVLVSVLRVRQCRVCGCTETDCQACIEVTGGPCHWVGPDLCSACTPQAAPLVEMQWALSFAQAAVIERALGAHNAAEHRRHDEAFQLRIVHRNERDYFVYLTIAKGELVCDEHLFQLGWQASQLAQQEGGVANG